MVDTPSRHLEFDFIGNLRDLGRFATRDGRAMARGRVYRSSEPRQETLDHLADLRRATGVITVIDLRAEMEIKREPVDLYAGAGIRYLNVPLIGGNIQEPEPEFTGRFTCMGEFYLQLMRDAGYRERIIRALEIIAEPDNHAVLFHCAVGKDRTGILAAFIYSILGVADEDIISDYAETAKAMPAFMEKVREEPRGAEMLEKMPAYMWEASPYSMEIFLAELQKDHGTLEGCLIESGADENLFQKLRDALLE